MDSKYIINMCTLHVAFDEAVLCILHSTIEHRPLCKILALPQEYFSCLRLPVWCCKPLLPAPSRFLLQIQPGQHGQLE